MTVTPLFGAGNSTTATSAAAASLACAKPANTADGDVLIAFVYNQFSAGTTGAPTGWTLAKASAIRAAGVYYKAVPSAAAETATSYTFTSSGSGRFAITVFRVTGASLSAPIDAVGVEPAQTVTSITLPAVTVVAPAACLLGFTWWNNSTLVDSTVTVDAAMTDGQQVGSPTSANTSGIDVAYQALTGTGSTGTRTMSTSPASATVSGWMLSIAPLPQMVLAAPVTSSRADDNVTKFYAPPNSVVVLALSAVGQTSSDVATASVSGGGLTWSLPVVKSAANGAGQPGSSAEFRIAYNTTGQFITATVEPTPNASNSQYEVICQPITITGVESSFTGATATSSGTGLPSLSLTTAAGSIVIAVSGDNAMKGAGTPDTGQTMLFDQTDSRTSVHLWRLNGTSSSGTTALDLTGPAAQTFNAAAIEFKAASSSTPATATGGIGFAGTASGAGATTAAGAVTFTGTASTTASTPATAAGSIAFAATAAATGRANSAGAITLAGTAAAHAAATAHGEILFSGSTPVQQWMANTPAYAAHRGGSADWPEETDFAYGNCAAWNPRLALEISVWQTTDGVWVCSHDQTTARVFTGTSVDITTVTWAAISGYTTIIGGKPIARLDDILNTYADGARVFLIDNKGQQDIAGMLTLLASHGGPANFILKGYFSEVAWPAAAAANGYQSWGYWFPADTAAGNLTSAQAAKWSTLGIEYDDTSTVWAQAVAFGKPVYGHIIDTLAHGNAALSLGASGLVASGVMEVVPASASSAGSIAIGGSAAGRAPATAAGGITIGGSATGVPASASSASGSIAFAATVSAAGDGVAAGSITFASTVSTSAHAVAAGGISFDGTATGLPPGNHAAGSIVFAATATAHAGAAAAGTVILAGAILAAANGVSSGLITFTGTASAASGAVPATATGGIVFAGTVTATAGPVMATAAGAITFGGTASPTASASAHGSITFTGTAASPAGRDVTFSATLDPPRWTAALDGRRWIAYLEDDVPRLIRASLGDDGYVSAVLAETSGTGDISTTDVVMSLGSYEQPGDAKTPDVVTQLDATHKRAKLLVGGDQGATYPAGQYYPWIRGIDQPEKEWLLIAEQVVIE